MKNKILKILSLIAICTLMIASLCSFTTVSPPDDTVPGEYDVVYSPSMDLKVGYVYHRRTSTISQDYYGYFLNPHTTIVYNNDISTIKNFASDYLVTGTKSFDYHSQSAQDLPSVYSLTGDYLAAEVVLESDDSATHEFTGSLIYSGLQKISEIDPWNEVCFYDENIGGFSPLDLSSYLFSVTVNVVNFDSGNYTTTEYFETLFGDSMVGQFGGINLATVVDLVLESHNVEAEFIDYVSISGAEQFYDFPIISIIDVLRPDTLEGVREYAGLLAEWRADILDWENSMTLMNTSYNILSNKYKSLEAQYAEALERIKELEEGLENNEAIPLLFDGLYKTLYNTLTIFFNMDVFGTKLGTIVGLLLGAAVVIIILKVVL